MGSKININGQSYSFTKGQTILDVCRANNIEVPTLCFLKDINEVGFCRVCVVEVKGVKDLVSSCNSEAKPGMEVLTDSERVIESRKTTLKLLAENHNFDCAHCAKFGKCEFLKMLTKYRINIGAYRNNKGRHEGIIEGTGICMDLSKCILCRRCVATCAKISSTKTLKFRDDNGLDPIVCPTPGLSFEDAGCIDCGQCIKECPTGALYETDHIEKVKAALADPKKFVVVQMAPAVRAALGEEFGFEIGTPVKDVQGKMYHALHLLGFDDITDTNWAADLTIIEEGTEFINRLTKGTGPLPLFTSCSPGWIRYIEQYAPEYLPNLSSAKSPHMMMGAMVKSYYAEKILKKDPKDIYMVSIMPCTAKKYEISRPEMENGGNRNVDAVLTTRELAKMIKEKKIDFAKLEDYQPTSPLAEFTGAGTIFGATGGVMEAALRSVYEIVTGQDLPKLEFEQVRGADSADKAKGTIKEASVNVGGTVVNVAVVHGGAAIKEMINILREGKKQYHFIEFMGCPGGCVNGGGQPFVRDEVMNRFDVAKLRAKALYDQDANDTPLRKSHKNESVMRAYTDYLGEPNGHKAHELLHTHYSAKESNNA